MTNDGNSQPLAVVIGERLKTFRDHHDLRQADIAAAATACGLAWSRSSVAALESGTRNLSVEELILLPFVISNAGGWEEPLIPPNTNIRIAKRMEVKADYVSSLIGLLFNPIHELDNSRTVPPEEEESVRWAVPPVEGFANELERLRSHGEVSTWRVSFSRLYPDVEFDHVIDAAKPEYELLTKISDRLETGWEDRPVPWYVAAVYGEALWGHSPGQERDHRAGDATNFPSKRSLQSARGHITRDLIREIQERLNNDQPILEHNFNRLRNIWNQEDKLRQYTIDTFAESDANRQNAGVPLQVVMVKAPDLASQTIGQVFQKARLEGGLTVEEVSAATRIRVPILHAIEQDDFSRCGGDVYARGHIRALARAVGLDPQPLLRRFDYDRGVEPAPSPAPPSFPEAAKPSGRHKRRRNKPAD